MGETVKYALSEEEIPSTWVNLLADLPGDPPPPPLSPATGEPIGPEDLSAIFPMALIEQEVSTDPDIEIPEEVRDIYRLWRPTPLFRARRLEHDLDTPAHIYYKYERGVSGGLPQAEHRHRPGLLQPRGRNPQARYGDRRGSVGIGALTRVPDVRARV